MKNKKYELLDQVNLPCDLKGFDDNQLISLDVSKNSALTALRCLHNKLKSLDVSKNTALEILICWDNNFDCDALKAK